MDHTTRIAGFGSQSRWTAGGCVLIAAALAASQGCTTDINSRRTIGAVRDLPALSVANVDASRVEIAATRLDRGDWTPVEFRVPVDGTVHGPLWKSYARFDDDMRRAHGLYPTAESALDLHSDQWDDRVRSVLDPVWAITDLAVMPVRAILQPARKKTQGPSMYKRWHSGEYLAGPMHDVADDATGESEDDS